MNTQVAGAEHGERQNRGNVVSLAEFLERRSEPFAGGEELPEQSTHQESVLRDGEWQRRLERQAEHRRRMLEHLTAAGRC